MTMQDKDNRAPQAEKSELTDAQLDTVAGGTGSQSAGAGSGKVTLSDLTITKKIDKSSPDFF